MGCAEYGVLNQSVGMASTVRVPRERQFHRIRTATAMLHRSCAVLFKIRMSSPTCSSFSFIEVVPVPGVFTRGRWKCRDYRDDDHMDSRDQILDFTDIREREVDAIGGVEKTMNEQILENKVVTNEFPVNGAASSPPKESSTIVVTSIAPAPMTPQRNTHHAEVTERAIKELERGDPLKAFSSRPIPSSHSLSSSALVMPTSAQATAAQGALTAGSSPGDEENLPSGSTASLSAPNVVAIDNKIEQAMDLVKTHLTFAVREEVEVLRQTIAELEQRVSSLENENQLLRQYAPGDVVSNISALVQQRKNNTNTSSLTQQHSGASSKK